MANLLIEIGNTALKAAWAEGKTLGKTVRYQGEKLHGFLVGTLLAKEKPDVLVLASVRDIPDEDIREIRERCGQLVLIDRNHPAILRAYGLPEYLSPSRAASIIAARELFKGKPCLVFDFGTVLSIDSISADGAYQGGNLSLGCRTRFKALNRYSRALPLVDTPSDPPAIGTSETSGIEAGVISGIVFEVDGYIAGAPGSVVVFTGGDASYFAKQTKNSIFVVSNLVLMGLATISEDYDRK